MRNWRWGFFPQTLWLIGTFLPLFIFFSWKNFIFLRIFFHKRCDLLELFCHYSFIFHEKILFFKDFLFKFFIFRCCFEPRWGGGVFFFRIEMGSWTRITCGATGECTTSSWTFSVWKTAWASKRFVPKKGKKTKNRCCFGWSYQNLTRLDRPWRNTTVRRASDLFRSLPWPIVLLGWMTTSTSPLSTLGELDSKKSRHRVF